MANEQTLREMLNRVARHDQSVEEALQTLCALPNPVEDIGFARIDHHRALRRGHPEVIYCAGKTAEQVASIFGRLARASPRVLGTRATAEQAAMVLSEMGSRARYDPLARTVWMDEEPDRPRRDGAVVVCAGTSDLPVAIEARITLDLMGYAPRCLNDVGVAGLHRLLAELPALRLAKVVIVVAGMEGALPSVVAGLISAPVIAVPTSVGYGASFGGLAALLGMLNSCSPGIGVVNIDNGLGAAYLAASILDSGHRSLSEVQASHADA
ncbi:MAG TPA: nickel pincer cofactor biosynthesis protein LarB [Tepidisphaeraceae bacterium]|jgi:hypothetical protein|nr:nickel pincer cofactor biosynthesis protein LarB [Tepidisphaeraceae bacterium]